MNQLRAAPERHHALEQYRRRAHVYDRELAPFEPIRRRAIESLRLCPGATVLDVGCGTGLSFAPLHAAVGAQGRIVGIEQCPEMLDMARQKVKHNGWTHVTLVNTPAELTALECEGDAALFHFTHDILRNPEAIQNTLRSLKPGAVVSAAGLQWANPLFWTTNWWVMMAAMYSVTSLEGLAQPWSHLAKYVDQWQVDEAMMGSVYIASGVVGQGRG